MSWNLSGVPEAPTPYACTPIELLVYLSWWCYLLSLIIWLLTHQPFSACQKKKKKKDGRVVRWFFYLWLMTTFLSFRIVAREELEIWNQAFFFFFSGCVICMPRRDVTFDGTQNSNKEKKKKGSPKTKLSPYGFLTFTKKKKQSLVIQCFPYFSYFHFLLSFCKMFNIKGPTWIRRILDFRRAGKILFWHISPVASN